MSMRALRRVAVAACAALTCLVMATPAHAITGPWYSTGFGGIDNPATGTSRISGEFHVPAMGTACGTSSRNAVWVGIGGSNPWSQLGITLTTGGYGAWYEVFDSAGNTVEKDVSFSVSAGDLVKLSESFSADRSTIDFRWQNLTTGTQHDEYLAGAAKYYNGDDAQWLLEIVEGVGANNLLRFYGGIDWQAAWYGTDTWAGDMVRAGSRNTIMMNTAGDSITSNSFPASTQSMTTYWQGCN